MLEEFEDSKAIHRLPSQFFAQLTQRVRELVAEGHDVINLGQGNPDIPTSDAIVKVMQEAVAKPINHKYPPFRGNDYFKEAVANFYKREYDVMIDAQNETVLTMGSKVGLFEVCQCLLDEGDTVLLPNPGYPDYLSGISMVGAKAEFMSLRAENDFLPQYDEIPEDILKRAKLMFINYPNNPTAATATREFFEETVKLAKKYKIAVVHDFAYGAFGFEGEKPISFLSVPGAKDIGIEFYSMSKSFSMAGWRAAFAAGNPSIIEKLNRQQDHLFTSLYGAIQEAATFALSEAGSEITQDLLQEYESRKNVFIDALRDIGWNVRAPKGTFFCWFEVPQGFTSAGFMEYLLEHAKIVVADGNGFGSNGEGYVRLGLLDTEERLLEAVERIKALNISFA